MVSRFHALGGRLAHVPLDRLFLISSVVLAAVLVAWPMVGGAARRLDWFAESGRRHRRFRTSSAM